MPRICPEHCVPPAGLSVDRATGRITGRVKKTGTCSITLSARNDLGEAKRTLRLVVGNAIALTPPLGWNSWNCWGCAVDDDKIRQAAEALVASALSNHGWRYINIDGCWRSIRTRSASRLTGSRRTAVSTCGRKGWSMATQA